MPFNRWADTSHKWLQLDDRTVGIYNCHDTVATARLHKALSQEMRDNGQWGFYRREFWPLVPAVLAMQRRGLPIEPTERRRIRDDLRSQVRTCDRTVMEAVGNSEFNPNSDAQLAAWLFAPRGEAVEIGPKAHRFTVKGAGLKGGRRTESQRRYSVDRDNLLTVYRNLRKMDQAYRPVVEALLHRSRADKLLEYTAFELVEDRCFPTVKMYGTKTLRLAYAEPPAHSWAEELRTMVAAPPGKMLLCADYSQIEARIAAIEAQDPVDLDIFDRYDRGQGRDIHTLTAEQCFGLDLDAVDGESLKKHRVWAKTFRYGVLLYGGEPETVKSKTFCPCPLCEGKNPDTLNLSRNKMREVADGWFDEHPAAKRYRTAVVDQVRTHHHLVTKFGYRRQFLLPWGSKELIRQAYNYQIQHCAFMVMSRAQRRLHNEHRAPIVLQHHDAFVLEVPEDSVSWWARVLRAEMERVVPELGSRRFPVDVTVGKSWGEQRAWPRGSTT